MGFNLVISPLAELDIAEAYAHYAALLFISITFYSYP